MQQLETLKHETNGKLREPLEPEEKNKASINSIQGRNSENFVGHYDTSTSLNHSCGFKIENGDIHPYTNHTLPIMNSPERLFKIIFVGDSGVGKTSFIHRFCNDKFLSTFHATVGIDYRVRTFVVKGHLIALQLWDTAGQERYKSISRQYFRKTDGVIFMYDVTSELSFRNIRNWMAYVKDNSDNRLVSVVVGNKRDLFQKEGLEITAETGEELAKKHESLFYETSCKTGQGIFDVMNQMACALQITEDQEIERIREIHCSKKRNKCC